MNIISSHKILLLFVVAVTLAAVSIPRTEAKRQFIRGTIEKEANEQKQEQEPRRLKTSKGQGSTYGHGHGHGESHGESHGQTTTTTTTTGVNANPQSQVISTTAGITVSAWEKKCSSQSKKLNTCVGGTDKEKYTCKQCVVSQGFRDDPTAEGVTSCNKIPSPDGWCGSNCKQQVLEFYDCGADKNLGNPLPLPPLSPPATISTPSITAELSSTNTVPSGGGLTSGGATAGYGPATYCPFVIPTSGDIGCDTKGYEFLRCYFPGRKVCTCRFDDPSTRWNCIDYSN